MNDTRRRRMRKGMTKKRRLAEIVELAGDLPRSLAQARHEHEREESRNLTHIRKEAARRARWHAQEVR